MEDGLGEHELSLAYAAEWSDKAVKASDFITASKKLYPLVGNPSHKTPQRPLGVFC